MREIKIKAMSLAMYCLLSIGILLAIAIIIYYLYSRPLSNGFPTGTILGFSTIFFTYALSWILLPLLIIRCLYFFAKMVIFGRREGVHPFGLKTLFNPINLLLFRSLLTPQGLEYRRRCLMSLILLLVLLAIMWVCIQLGIQLSGQETTP